jgi:nucleoside phosphorylase
VDYERFHALLNRPADELALTILRLEEEKVLSDERTLTMLREAHRLVVQQTSATSGLADTAEVRVYVDVLPVDFIIVAPLEQERQAILSYFGDPKRLPPTSDDIRVYYPVSFPVVLTDGKAGKYSLIIMDLVGMGRIDAATAVTDAIRRWQPKFVILVGIAGGVADAGVRLGDVLISEQIADYEQQKLKDDETEIRWSVHPVDARLHEASNQLRTTDWRPICRCPRPGVGQSERHIGVICTGDKVIANGLINTYRDEVWSKLIGVEMEAGGVAKAAFQAAKRPGFYMIRGVSDLADRDKNASHTINWRQYACEIAAAYLVAFLQSGPIPLSHQ